MAPTKIISGIIALTTLVFACTSNGPLNRPNEVFSQEQSDSLKRIECDALLSEMQRTNADTIKRVKQIPKNFEESLVSLDSMLTPQMKAWIKCLPDGEFGITAHHGFGMYLRNNWGLWGNSELAQNLYYMGILHPDDMSAIILDSYQRKLKGEAIRLDEQLKYYQDYWSKAGMPVDSILNELAKSKQKE